MPPTEDSLLWSSVAILGLLATMAIGWMLYTSFFYIRGVVYYRMHVARKQRKRKVRKQEEAFRTWKREHEGDWIRYQFQYQTALINARKLPGDFEPDCPEAPCEPPPSIEELEDSDKAWEDNAKWLAPPNFCRYWCSRERRFLDEEKATYDSQHIKLKKTNDEYREWKRNHEEEMQRAIKNHPIATTFLNLARSDPAKEYAK